MSNKGRRPDATVLAQFHHCLEIYTAALNEWQHALDEAAAEINKLSACQRHENSDLLDQFETSSIDLAIVQGKVEAGWIIYKKAAATSRCAVGHSGQMDENMSRAMEQIYNSVVQKVSGVSNHETSSGESERRVLRSS